MSSFYAYLSRMKYIQRWSLMRNTVSENIMEHSAQVAILAHGLCVIGNCQFGESYNADRAVLIALFHDASEVITGDLPTPIKYYNPEIKSAYNSIEKVATQKLISLLPDEMKSQYLDIFNDNLSKEYMIVKYADKLSAYIKCLEELKSGNKEFLKAEKTIKEDLMRFNSKEIDYFLENFISEFSMTLDELD